MWTRAENRPVTADAREARESDFTTFSSFGLSGMPTFDSNTKIFCSHEASVCPLLCQNSCLWQYSLWRCLHLKTTWPRSRKAVIAAHLHFAVPAFSIRPPLPLPPLSFFSIKQLANFLCLTSTLVTIFPQKESNTFDFCMLSNFIVTLSSLSDCLDSPWYPLSIFCLLSCHSAPQYLVILQLLTAAAFDSPVTGYPVKTICLIFFPFKAPCSELVKK